MTLFYYRTLLFYLVANTYLFFHFRRLCARKSFAWLFLPWFVCMGLFPLIFIKLPPGMVQDTFRLLGMYWLPAAFFGVVLFAVRDALFLLFFLIKRISPRAAALPSPPRALIFLPVLLCLGLYAYGLYEARNIQVTRVEVPARNISAKQTPLRLVFAADLHIGTATGTGMLQKTVDLIMEQKPDCILLGGDLLDDAMQGTPADQAELARLAAPLGVYAVLGNHESFGDHKRAAAFIRQSGLTLLEGKSVRTGPLRIIGLDDPAIAAKKGGRSARLSPHLEQTPSAYTIVLDHRPVMRPYSIGRFDLQLSGHSHNGQIFIFKPLMRMLFKTEGGLSEHTRKNNSSRLYVTSGIGFSKLPIRLLVPPEVVVIDLVRP